MAIHKITKIEYDKIKHDQKWGVFNCLLFVYEGGRYKCDQVDAVGLKEIHQWRAKERKMKRDQLHLLKYYNDI